MMTSTDDDLITATAAEHGFSAETLRAALALGKKLQEERKKGHHDFNERATAAVACFLDQASAAVEQPTDDH